MKNNKGFAALIVVLISAVLAILSFLTIQYGRISLNVSNEKQVLDSCGIEAGKNIIKTNNITDICTERYLNNCSEFLGMPLPDFTCEDLDVECDLHGVCQRNISISSTYNPGRGDVTKSIMISVSEEKHDVNIIDAAVVMLLDYSGSMNGNRINQLKNTVSQFINSNFNLSYSVILYNDTIISTSNIGKGQNHNQTAMSIVNSTSASGGTNFILPLQEAISQIENSDYEVYYILLISDGSPNEGPGPSQEFVNNNIRNINRDFCVFSTNANPCITIFTLGVDNANANLLGSISGNSISQDVNNYSYLVNSNQTVDAFNAIISEIMCRIGPVIADGVINVFDGLEVLEEGVDYIFDNQNKILKFYDVDPFNVCSQMLNNNSDITLRWGKPKLKIIE